MKTLYYPLLAVLISFSVTAQSNDHSYKLYDDTHIARIDITIDPAALEWIYQNVESDSLHYAVFHFQNNWINEIVDSIGFRLRGNTSRFSAKKSFKVSFNTFMPGREFYGVDKLNINGEHNDPSIIRSKLCFDHFRTIGLTASRANHVKVYINGTYYGLYISVEHIDDEFLEKNFVNDTGNLWKCLYPADLNYLGSDPNIYKNLNNNGRPVYELTRNDDIGDFSKLVRLIDILNNTSSAALTDSLETIINIPDLLKYFAINILTGSWDDYWSLMNNYYLYHEPSLDKFQLIPYDYDNTYGIDWFGINWSNANPYNFPKVVSGYRPLAERLMQSAEYRNLYTHFLQFYRENVYQLDIWRDRIDSLRTMITEAALQDTFRTLDYGFDDNDFFNSYSETGYNNQHVKYGLKQFVNLRNNSLPAQLSYQSAKPVVYQIDHSPRFPLATDSIYVNVSAFDSDGLNEVSIYFRYDDSTTTLIYPMTFASVSNTKKVEEADRYIGVIPPLGVGKSAKFFVYAKDTQNQFQFYPRKEGISISTYNPAADNVVINEFMADNVAAIADPSGDYDDWIELYNPTNEPILLTGKYLTDKPNNLTKWRFTQPSLYINSGEYLIIWCDEQQSQPGIHTNFKLSKEGEYIAITAEDGVSVIDSLTFGPQKTDTSFARFPDASGNWTFLFPSTPGASNNVTGVQNEMLPIEFTLSAYPNPFNPSTTIAYSIPNTAKIKIEIFDLLGRRIWFSNEGEKFAGTYKIIWNGANSFDNAISSGIYLVRLQANQSFKSIKLLMLK